MRFTEELEKLIPRDPSEEIAWDAADALIGIPSFRKMKSTPQDPVYHGEGDVYTHTRMVCRELIRLPAFGALPPRQKSELFLAALLHDVGKSETTRRENGRWTSPRHAETGAQIARAFLWRDCGLCGDPDAVSFRETVCALIRRHMLPVRLAERGEEPEGEDGTERLLRGIASVGELARDFSWHLLCLLAEADIAGRTADDVEEGKEKIGLCRMAAEDAGCLSAPFAFADAHTKRAYLSGRNVLPDQNLFDDTSVEAVMMAGLPGTGKDTWIRARLPGLPMISLDAIRKELRISPTDGDSQGKVFQEAQERARDLLRREEPFVFNATNLTEDIRRKWIGLFERYGARVRVVYLETEWENRIARNAARREAVPESVVDRMLEKTALPMPAEARAVEWVCV